VSRKWRNFGCAGSGSRTGAGETVCKSLHLDKSSDRGLNSEHFLWGKKEIPVKSTRALAGISVLLVLLLSVSGCGGAGTALATPPHSTVTSDIKATQQSSTTVTLSPVSLFFGTQLLATPSTASAVALTNSGTSAVTINSITVAEANSGDFGVSHNCPISPNTLGAGSGCTLQITFTPQTAGPRKSSISISDNSGSGAQTIIVTGVGAAISAAPSELNFNSQQVGTSSSALPVVITTACFKNRFGLAVGTYA